MVLFSDYTIPRYADNAGIIGLTSATAMGSLGERRVSTAEQLRPRSQMMISIVFVSVLCTLVGLIIMFADTTGHPWIDAFGQVCWAIAIIAAVVGLLG